mgnify:CR=1 FL=1
MKCALFLPGHMRIYKKTLDNQNSCIIEPLNCDIYISTSAVDTTVNGNDIVIERYDKETLKKEIINSYSSRLKGLTIEDEETDKEAKLGGKQWMRLQQCNEMRKKYEKENNFKYDFIIRARTDLVFGQKLVLNDVIENAIFLLKHFDSKIPVHDQFAFGNSELMDIYCQLYDHFLPRDKGGRSEEQLHNWLIKNEVKLFDISSKFKFSMLRG